MFFEGVHHTSYAYSDAVFIEPHTLRLRPRNDPRQTVHSFSIDVAPKPDGMTEGIDVYGNDVMWTWFSGMHATLDITTRFVVETLRENPYDYVVPSIEEATIPPAYPDTDRSILDVYRTPTSSGTVRAMADEVVEATGGDLVSFLRDLAARIHSNTTTIIRPEGDPFPAAETLASREGSCRDVAVLFVEACRHVGVAARFVSGYVSGEPGQLGELHAWGAAYIPGAGWRGYDPTAGLAVSDRHVTLAAAASPAGAAPVDGRFRGTAVRSELTSEIELNASSGPQA